MSIVTDLTSTGYTGKFSTTSGSYTYAGTVTTDADKALKVFSGDITETSSSTKVGTFSFYFNSADSSVQSTVTTAIETVRAAVDADLDTAA